MAARLEGHIERRASGPFACPSQGVNLRMWLAETLVPAFADHHSIMNNNSSDQRIRLDIAATFFGQLECPQHPFFVALFPGFTLQERKPRNTRILQIRL